MIYEFREPIEVDTPLGRGQAFFVHATAHDNHWTVALHDCKGFVTFHQDKIRATNSYSAGRGIDDERMRAVIKGG
jgi:hypothetical protein